MRYRLAIAALAVLTFTQFVSADGAKITVDVAHPGVKISPMLYGLMTEEINHSYDGGLYAELIQNRAFLDNAKTPAHWSVLKTGDAKITLDGSDPVNKTSITKSLRLDITTPGERAGIANDGYWGIPVWPNTAYKASFYAKASAGFSGSIAVGIEQIDGSKIFAHATISAITSEWKKYEVDLSTTDVPTSASNHFVISTTSPGTVWFSLVSLFPPTYKNRPNGNRIDLMQKLDEMHTAFLRLPGGNYLEGNTIDERFKWDKTLGALEDRPGHQGPWGYHSTDGFGLDEFFGWCEDLKIQPVLAVYAGYSLRGAHVNPGPDLVPFVQEAMDEIEYSIGDQTTKFGQLRAKNGHAAPYDVKYVEIGNEDWFDKSGSYEKRFAQINDAIKAKYPQLKTISTTPLKTVKPDVVDDHYYRSARAMERDVHHYDKISRTGPAIFVGEWATEEGTPTPDMNAALGDAAWLTGLERNSDLVIMSCYAPLLVNVNSGARQWPTNLIGYDAVSSFGSPSYYAQKMFNENRGDTVLPIDVVQPSIDPSQVPPSHGGVGVGTWETNAEFKDIKVTSGDTVLYSSDFSKNALDWRPRDGSWSVQYGAYRQTGNTQNARATIGDTTWSDYTYSLKARKISGSEGFLIVFHVEGRNSYSWWNVGGWGNTRSGLEQITDGAKVEVGPTAPLTIEAGKWYDIRVELKGHDMKFYLDDKLITEATESASMKESLITTASRDDASGDVIIKVVNISLASQTATIELAGAANVSKSAKVQVLQGNPRDVNTLAEPEKVFPQQADIADTAASFTHEFPKSSVTVMRLSTK